VYLYDVRTEQLQPGQKLPQGRLVQHPVEHCLDRLWACRQVIEISEGFAGHGACQPNLVMRHSTFTSRPRNLPQEAEMTKPALYWGWLDNPDPHSALCDERRPASEGDRARRVGSRLVG
jgi:hypothetical protein